MRGNLARCSASRRRQRRGQDQQVDSWDGAIHARPPSPCIAHGPLPLPPTATCTSATPAPPSSTGWWRADRTARSPCAWRHRRRPFDARRRGAHPRRPPLARLTWDEGVEAGGRPCPGYRSACRSITTRRGCWSGRAYHCFRALTLGRRSGWRRGCRRGRRDLPRHRCRGRARRRRGRARRRPVGGAGGRDVAFPDSCAGSSRCTPT